jgi:UDP-3-O-[3-hydroxymyristoyl] glucosamine N-acyltransferase
MATIQRIAGLLGVDSTPNDGVSITRIASPESATGDALVFATSADALQAALESPAGCILANIKIAEEVTDPRVVRVPDARLAFAIVADHLKPLVPAVIDATASIAPTVRIGKDVSIGAGAVLGDGVIIGDRCVIGPRVVIESAVTLGDRVQIQAGAVLGSLGFGYARRPDGSYLLFPQRGTLVIEDDVEIGANTTIDRGALGETRIGAGTKIDNLVHIGHNCRIGRNVIIAAQTGISGSSIVEDGAILGGQVGMGEHALVGTGVILGGGAGVLSGKKLRGPGQVFWGRPARPLKQYLRDLARLSRGR